MRPEIVSGIVTAGQPLANFSPEVFAYVGSNQIPFCFSSGELNGHTLGSDFIHRLLRTTVVQQRAILAIILLTYFITVADNDIQEEPELVCKHGIPLNGAIRDSHKVNCVKCERPFSRGGRALAGMLAFRRAETKRRKSKRILNTKRLSEEQEKRKRMEGEYDDALRRFAEKHPSN